MTADRQGHCFVFAFRNVSNHGGVLVHGSAAGVSNHAWVDHGDYIYEPTHDRYYPRGEYIDRFAPREVNRYDAVTALVTFLQHDHYGPWN